MTSTLPPHSTRWLFIAAATLLGGCSTLQPAVDVPQKSMHATAYRQTTPTSADNLDAATWRGFADPVLTELMHVVQRENLDVRIAQQRVLQAQAGSTAIASRLWPTLSVNTSASDQRSGLPTEVKRGMPDARAIRGALDLGWEIDVAGAARAAADAAALDALAAGSGVEVARWLASTEIARHYLLWQGARLRLQHAQALVNVQEEIEALVRRRQTHGLASNLEVARAAAELQALAAQLPALHTLVTTTEHQIDVLLGRSPSALEAPWRQAPAALPSVPGLMPGQTPELLNRRPDLRVAEQQLRAESARLRESQADLWPRFFLSSVLGQQDLRLNGLDLAPVAYRSVALLFTAPVFNAGRLRAAVERQSARERAATLQYEKAVLNALQDVESSLVVLAQERQRCDSLATSLASRRLADRHAHSLAREGQIDRLQRLEVSKGLLSAELALTEAQTQRALAAVQLIKALGGGWNQTPAAPLAQSASTQP